MKLLKTTGMAGYANSKITYYNKCDYWTDEHTDGFKNRPTLHKVFPMSLSAKNRRHYKTEKLTFQSLQRYQTQQDFCDSNKLISAEVL